MQQQDLILLLLQSNTKQVQIGTGTFYPFDPAQSIRFSYHRSNTGATMKYPFMPFGTTIWSQILQKIHLMDNNQLFYPMWVLYWLWPIEKKPTIFSLNLV